MLEEYERLREEIARKLAENLSTIYFVSPTGLLAITRNWADQILKTEGIRIEAADQSLPRDYIWPQTTQSKEEMRRYQTGEIDKPEHERQRGLIIDEELAIYQKAQQDMLTPDSEGRVWVKCLPKPK